MSRSSPWPTSWRGSPGRCCSAGNRLTPTRYPWPRRDSFGRSESAGRASGVCERVTTRWPDSQMALRKPGVENGARRRRVYEDRGARISILAGRRPPRPDTLKQTDQPSISTKPLQTGRANAIVLNPSANWTVAGSKRLDQLVFRTEEILRGQRVMDADAYHLLQDRLQIDL